MARVKVKRSARASNSAMLSGTKRRKRSRFPSQATGPLRVKARRAGVG